MCTNAVEFLTCSCKSGYCGNGTLCTEIDECADCTQNSHPGPAMRTEAVGFFLSCSNQVMIRIGLCVLTLLNVLMVLIFVIMVLQCVLMLWALLPAHGNQGMLGIEHCVLTLNDYADGTHNCHPGRAWLCCWFLCLLLQVRLC